MKSEQSKILNYYLIKSCRGPDGCPNAVHQDPGVSERIAGIFKKLDFGGCMQTGGSAEIKSHQQFKVSISYCPNSCSMPQIADIGIILAGPVKISTNPCSFCKACVKACQEKAIQLDKNHGPQISEEKCLFCGKCAKVCPRKTIVEKPYMYRIQVGGRLGRHPRLATEIPGLFPEKNLLLIVEKCLRLFMENYPEVKRFADLFNIFEQEQIFERLKLTLY